MAAVFLESLGQEGSAKLEVGEPLVQPERTGQGVGQQSTLVEVCSCLGSKTGNRSLIMFVTTWGVFGGKWIC